MTPTGCRTDELQTPLLPSSAHITAKVTFDTTVLSQAELPPTATLSLTIWISVIPVKQFPASSRLISQLPGCFEEHMEQKPANFRLLQSNGGVGILGPASGYLVDCIEAGYSGNLACVKAAELRAYLKSKGAEISEENAEGGLHVDLAQIIEVCDVCLKEDDKDVESVMNSVVSLLLILEPDKQEALIENLCEKLVKFREGERPSLRLQLLSNLFHGMDKNTPVRYTVYCSLLKVASSCGAIQYIPTELDQVRKWISDWNLGTEKKHTLLRLLYDVLVDCKKSDAAAKVMVELLGSYTEDNASQARVDAHRCIVRALKDPNTFLFDHLLALKPVKFLEGELIHDLLTIFVSAKLVSYVKFYQNNKDFIDSLGLLHEHNMAKMRLLTFMGMAVENKEISFDTMQQELQIGADDVEAFVIDAVKTKMVYCKIDQTQRKVVVSHSTHRTFGKQQWQQLYDTLNTWKQNLNQVKNSLLSLSDT
nr:PREDICTED: eukaryotic translation initiation factor 3 subunit M [Opisthocomus hoazin]